MTQDTDSRLDRPVTKQVDEFEITPEMVAAGEDVLLSELGGAVSVFFWDADDLAKRVFAAMQSRRPHPSRL
jgi:hypothetical protein